MNKSSSGRIVLSEEEIEAAFQSVRKPPGWVEAVSGIMTDTEAFDEAMKYAREWREEEEITNKDVA